MLVFIAAAVVASALLLGSRTRRSVRGRRIAGWLRVSALALISGGLALSVPHLLADRNSAVFTALVIAIPMTLVGLPVGAARRRAAPLVDLACGLALLAFSLVFALGVGLFLFPGAVVLVLAAGVSGKRGNSARERRNGRQRTVTRPPEDVGGIRIYLVPRHRAAGNCGELMNRHGSCRIREHVRGCGRYRGRRRPVPRQRRRDGGQYSRTVTRLSGRWPAGVHARPAGLVLSTATGLSRREARAS